jgi:hypothetical protein
VVDDTALSVRCLRGHYRRQTDRGRLVAVSKREFNTPIREPWNVMIHQSLQAIDRHNRLWFDSGDGWHLQQAQVLRDYVAGLKTWIHREERNG